MTDRANAMALKLAERHLIKMGWKYSVADIGKTAAQILFAMETQYEASRAAIVPAKEGDS